MTHFLIMLVVAGATAVVLALSERATPRERLWHGAKVFGEFLLVGLGLAWVLYFLPFGR